MDSIKKAPYVIETEDGRLVVFKNIEEFEDSEYRDDWVMRSYAESYEKSSEGSEITPKG